MSVSGRFETVHGASFRKVRLSIFGSFFDNFFSVSVFPISRPMFPAQTMVHICIPPWTWLNVRTFVFFPLLGLSGIYGWYEGLFPPITSGGDNQSAHFLTLKTIFCSAAVSYFSALLCNRPILKCRFKTDCYSIRIIFFKIQRQLKDFD